MNNSKRQVIKNTQERNNLASEIRLIRGVKNISEEKKDELIDDLLKIADLPERNKIQSVIDNYFASADHFYNATYHGSSNTQKAVEKLGGRFKEDTPKIKIDYFDTRIDPEQLKKGNNVYACSAHGFGCNACGGLMTNMMMVELAVKNNNMVIIANKENMTYITSEGVISNINGEIYSGSYEKLGLLALLFIGGFNNYDYRLYANKYGKKSDGKGYEKEYHEDMLKKYTGSKSLKALSYEKIKSKLANSNDTLGVWNEGENDGVPGVEDKIKDILNSALGKSLGLTEDNIKNIEYTKQSK